MKKEIFNVIKRELRYIVFSFLLVLVVFKIAFFKENFIVLLRNVLSLFWLFVLPGYFIMLYWNEKLSFMGRFAVGIAIAAALIGISSYYLGLIGLNIKYHAVLLPLAIMSIGLFILMKNK